MKKLLYIALTNYEDPADGVSIKVHSQIKGLEELGYDVYCASYGEDGVYLYHKQGKELLEKKSKVPQRILFMSALLKHLKEQQYDVCYIRFPFIDWHLKQVIKKLKSDNTTLYIEVATYPIYQSTFKKDGLVATLLYKQHTFFSRDLKKYVDKVLYIGNTTDNIWGCDAELIPNGCNVEQFALKKQVNNGKDELVLIVVAAMYARHGFERLFDGMADYYRDGKPETVVKLYMVGEGPERENYQQFTKENGLEEYITFTGAKSGAELEELFDESDVAVAALGMYKEDIYQASTLKVKEYLSRGIPFVYACDEIGLSEALPYVLKVENQPGNLDVKKVVDFYQEVKGKDFRNEMREYAVDHYSWAQIYRKAILGQGE